METRSASSHRSSLHLLPAPLLALVVSHLPPVSLLHLQRCLTAHHRLRSDDSYMTVAWRWAEVRLTEHLNEKYWLLPREQCVDGGERRCMIPASMWRAAVAVLRAAMPGWSVMQSSHSRLSRRSEILLRELVRTEQPIVCT